MEHTQTSQDPRGETLAPQGETLAPQKVLVFQSRDAPTTMEPGAMVTEGLWSPSHFRLPKSDPHSQKIQSNGPVYLRTHI